MMTRPGPDDVAIEAARRVAEQSGRSFHGALFVVRRSHPVTRLERVLLAAACLARIPVAVVPHKSVTSAEWLLRYATRHHDS
jgi:hypothetical protein